MCHSKLKKYLDIFGSPPPKNPAIVPELHYHFGNSNLFIYSGSLHADGVNLRKTV